MPQYQLFTLIMSLAIITCWILSDIYVFFLNCSK